MLILQRLWNNPCYIDFKPKVSVIPDKAVCYTCGWMYQDHQIWAHKDELHCPEAPTMPGYPRPENGAETIDQFKQRKQEEDLQEISRLKKENNQLRGELNERWNSIPTQKLEKEKSELQFRVDSQRIRIKELEIQVESSKHGPQCYPTRYRWEKEKEILDVRSLLERKEKELQDTLNSKTISAHNYYECNTKWQPIETAPKDGAFMLAIVHQDYLIVRWNGKSWEDQFGVLYHPKGFFYWMPLSPIPKI